MKKNRSASAHKALPFISNIFAKTPHASSPNTLNTMINISPNPWFNALGWLIGLVVACGIVIINSETQTDFAPTILYITLLLMAANLFSINVVISVALLCILLLTATYLYNGGYQHWNSTTGFFRCLTALSAITFWRCAANTLRSGCTTTSCI